MLIKTKIGLFVACIITCEFVKAQVAGHFYLNEGSCSSKFYFDNTGIFFSARGCAGIFTVNYGTYTLSRNLIFLKPESFERLVPFTTFVDNTATKDTAIKITFLARYKKTIPDKSFAVDAIDSSGKYYKRHYLNEEGSILINPIRYKSLRVNYLNHYYQKWVYIPIEATDMTVELSLPPEFFQRHHPKIEMSLPGILTVSEDGLYNNKGKRIGIPEN